MISLAENLGTLTSLTSLKLNLVYNQLKREEVEILGKNLEKLINLEVLGLNLSKNDIKDSE